MEQAAYDQRFVEGVRLFNEREFFDCHEVLEDLWNDQQGSEKQLTQGILQIGVGYYHYLRSNSNGARKLLARGLGRLRSIAAERDWGFPINPFIEDVAFDLEALDTECALRIPKIALNRA